MLMTLSDLLLSLFALPVYRGRHCHYEGGEKHYCQDATLLGDESAIAYISEFSAYADEVEIYDEEELIVHIVQGEFIIPEEVEESNRKIIRAQYKMKDTLLPCGLN